MPDLDQGLILQVLTLLLHGGWILPLGVGERSAAKGNQALLEACLSGAPYSYAALPHSGTALLMKDTDWILYHLHQSKTPASQWPEQIVQRLAQHNKSLAHDGQPITDDTQRLRKCQELIDSYAPKHELLKALGGA